MNLVDDIRIQLRRRGHIQAAVAMDQEADEWRRAARAAARQLSRPIETVQHGHIVVASLMDWPANPLEEEVQEAEMQNVVHRMANGITE